jgi:hypothetical protein
MTARGRRPVAVVTGTTRAWSEQRWWQLCQPHDVVSSVVSNGRTLVVDDILPLLTEENP